MGGKTRSSPTGKAKLLTAKRAKKGRVGRKEIGIELPSPKNQATKKTTNHRGRREPQRNTAEHRRYSLWNGQHVRP